MWVYYAGRPLKSSLQAAQGPPPDRVGSEASQQGRLRWQAGIMIIK